MRKILSLLLVVLMILPTKSIVMATDNVPFMEFYVSAKGSDANDGRTAQTPFKTLEYARDEVRKYTSGMTGNIVVNILGSGGNIYLDKPFRLYSEDSGRNGYRIIYRGIPTEGKTHATVSAGVPLTGFVESEKHPFLWEAKVENEDIILVREMYVNNAKAHMARNEVEITGIDFYKESGSRYSTDGMYISKEFIGDYENPEDIEFRWSINWKHVFGKVDDILPDPSDNSRMIVKMNQPQWAIRATVNDSGLSMKPYRPFTVVNAFELLDTPGEFYFNRKTRMLYYMPRENEDMTTAEVIIPNHDKIIKLQGNDVDDKVENITFEKLLLGHASYNGPGEGGVSNAQATYTEISSGVVHETQGAIHLNMTKGISFYDNYFFGLAAVGVSVYNGAYDTTFIGNAFSDIGETAFVGGARLHDEDSGVINENGTSQAPPEDDNLELNLMNGYRKMWGSYNGSIDILRGDIYQNYVTEYKYDRTWSDPVSPGKGQKSYFKVDLDDEYTISKITLGFDPAKVSDGEKQGFEILLSNDYQFREGRYEVVATQNTPANEWQEYIPRSTEKYRYLMIRTVGANTLKLSGLYVFTKDRKPYTVFQQCKGLVFKNNYLKRVGETQQGGSGITYYYYKNAEFINNEVYDVPYSGFGGGWGWWRTPNGSSDITISKNYTENTSLSIHDGAPFYTLSFQPNSYVTENYANYDVAGSAGYYFDMATNYMVWNNNVATNTNKTVLANDEGGENVTTNYYSTNTKYVASTSNHPTIHRITAANPSIEAKKIMENAGLTPEYEHIRDWVNKNQIFLPQEEYRLKRSFEFLNLSKELAEVGIEGANAILEENTFGDLPGQYPIKYKYLLQTALEEVEKSGEDKLLRGHNAQKLRLLMMEAEKAFNRKELSELLKDAETLVSSSVTGSNLGNYSKSAIDSFKGKISYYKEKLSSGMTFEEEYKALRTFEAEYREFANSKITADVEYIYVDGMTECKIDKENKVITLVFPYNMNFADKYTLDITLSSGAIIKKTYENISLNEDIEIQVYNANTQKNKVWTVETVYEADNSEWINSSGSEYSVIKRLGETYLAPRYYPHMGALMKKGQATELKFKCSGMTENPVIKFILASGSKYGVDKNSFKTAYNHLEFEVNGEKATLYYVENTSKTIINPNISISKIKKDNINSFAFTISENGKSIKVEQDGNEVYNSELPVTCTDGFIGILNENEGISVLQEDISSLVEGNKFEELSTEYKIKGGVSNLAAKMSLKSTGAQWNPEYATDGITDSAFLWDNGTNARGSDDYDTKEWVLDSLSDLKGVVIYTNYWSGRNSHSVSYYEVYVKDRAGNKHTVYNMGLTSYEEYTLNIPITDVNPVSAVGIKRYNLSQSGADNWNDTAGKICEIGVFGTKTELPPIATGEIFYNTSGKVAQFTNEYLLMPGIKNLAPTMTCANTAGSMPGYGIEKATDESVSSTDAHIWDNSAVERGSLNDDREWVSTKPLLLEGIVIYTDCNQRNGGQCISYYDVYAIDTEGNKKVLYSMNELAPQGYYTLKVSISEELGPIKAVGIDRYTLDEAGVTSWTDSAGKLVELRVFGKVETYATGEIFYNTSGKVAALTSEYLSMPGIKNLAPSMTCANTAGSMPGYGIQKATDESVSSTDAHIWDNSAVERGLLRDDREWVSTKPLSLEGIVIYTDCNQRNGGQCISYYDVYAIDLEGNKKVLYTMDELAPQGFYTLRVSVNEDLGAVRAVGIDRYTANEAGITSWTDSAGKLVELRVFGKVETYATGEIFYNTSGKVAALTSEYLSMHGVKNLAPTMTCANTAGSMPGYGIQKATDESVSSTDAHIWDNSAVERGTSRDDREWVSERPLSLEGIVIYTDCNQRNGGQCISYYDVYAIDLNGNKKILYSMAEEAPQGYYTLKVSISEELGPIKAVGIDRYTLDEAGIASWADSAGKLVELRVFGKAYEEYFVVYEENKLTIYSERYVPNGFVAIVEYMDDTYKVIKKIRFIKHTAFNIGKNTFELGDEASSKYVKIYLWTDSLVPLRKVVQ